MDFETAGIAEGVGTDWLVHGIVSIEAMVDLADRQCSDLPRPTHKGSDAVALSVDGDRFDAAVCMQVDEYVEDANVAVAELTRVLESDGRGAKRSASDPQSGKRRVCSD